MHPLRSLRLCERFHSNPCEGQGVTQYSSPSTFLSRQGAKFAKRPMAVCILCVLCVFARDFIPTLARVRATRNTHLPRHFFLAKAQSSQRGLWRYASFAFFASLREISFQPLRGSGRDPILISLDTYFSPRRKVRKEAYGGMHPLRSLRLCERFHSNPCEGQGVTQYSSPSTFLSRQGAKFAKRPMAVCILCVLCVFARDFIPTLARVRATRNTHLPRHLFLTKAKSSQRGLRRYASFAFFASLREISFQPLRGSGRDPILISLDTYFSPRRKVRKEAYGGMHPLRSLRLCERFHSNPCEGQGVTQYSSPSTLISRQGAKFAKRPTEVCILCVLCVFARDFIPTLARVRA